MAAIVITKFMEEPEKLVKTKGKKRALPQSALCKGRLLDAVHLGPIKYTALFLENKKTQALNLATKKSREMH